MSDKKKSLGEKLDSILPPEKVYEYVQKAKELFSNLVNRNEKTEAPVEKKAEKKPAKAKASKKTSDQSKDEKSAS